MKKDKRTKMTKKAKVEKKTAEVNNLKKSMSNLDARYGNEKGQKRVIITKAEKADFSCRA